MKIPEEKSRREEIIKYAKQLAEEYRSDDNLIACFITGSFTSGLYKKYSDVDLHFIFSKYYKKEYAVYGLIYKGIRFDLIFDDVQTFDDLCRRQFGNEINSAIEIWDKDNFIKGRRDKHVKIIKLGFLQILQQKRSLRYKCLNYLMTASSYLFEGNNESAAYVLRRCIDEIVQIERLIRSDPYWNQYKANVEWLKGKGNEEIYDIFRSLNVNRSIEELNQILRRIAVHVNGLKILEKWLNFPFLKEE